jgi:hypothetical protein
MGGHKWGRGKSLIQAREAALLKASDSFIAYFCGDDQAEVDSAGNIVHTRGTHRPTMIGRFTRGRLG